MKSILWLFTLVIFLVPIRAEAQASKFINIKAAYPPYIDCAQLFVAIEKGFFREEGLQVDTVKITSGSEIIEAVRSGRLEVGFSNYVSLAQAKNAGADLIALCGGSIENRAHVESAIFVKKSSAIVSPSGLQGKKIAVNVRNNIIELLLLEYLEKQNIGLQTVQIVDKPFPQLIPGLLSNEIDAAPLIGPFKKMAEHHDSLRVLSHYVVDMYPAFEGTTYAASGEWVRGNKAVADKFRRAMKKATAYCMSHPEEVKRLIPGYTPFTPEQMANTALPAFGYRISEKGVQSIIQMMYKRAWITKAFPARSLIYETAF
jgi:NitT/TauT family transport system substrate-binding protein